MSGGTFSAAGRLAKPLPGWVPAVALLIGTALIGPSLGGVSRVAFVAGCGAAGWYAWRQGPAAHLQTALALFAFAPFVRRVVDLSIGFDQAGIMLIGPLLALIPPVAQLHGLLESKRPLARQMAPLLLVGACVIYATVLSLVQSDWMNAASGALKWLVPLLYAASLIESADADDLVQAAASGFLVILPIIGLYGLYQYVDPPAWDRYWLNFAPIMSAGDPVPYGVRTFSAMNGPESFASFTAVGLLLVFFLRSGWLTVLLASPAILSFFLSLWRTAWISLGVSVLFCLLLPKTRARAAAIVLGLVAAMVVAVSLSPFSDTISDRLSTLTEGSQDASARERLDEFVTLWKLWDSSLFGAGFTVGDVGIAGALPVDGMIIACWINMGIVVGLVCLSGFVWATANAIAAPWRRPGREAIMIGALACSAAVHIPLANIASGELGFLFWTFAVLAPSRPSSA